MLSMKNVSKLINYPFERQKPNDNEMNDVFDGVVWKDIMETEYMKEADTRIGLGVCFDGMDIYNKRNSNGNICSLEISILNLPPSIRHKAAFGIQLVIILNQSEKYCKSLEDIFQLFVDELILLYNGINYKDSDNNIKLCRAAVVFVASDTKAHEKLFRVSGPNSNVGCYHCLGFNGTYSNELHKCYYIGHRKFLKTNNYLRRLSNVDSFYLFEIYNFLTIEVNEETSEENILQFIENEELEAPTARTMEQYRSFAKIAVESNRPCGGVHGLSVFCQLPYFDIYKQAPFDEMHCFSGIVKNRIQLLKGDRGCNNKVRAHEKSLERFKHIWNEKVILIFENLNLN